MERFSIRAITPAEAAEVCGWRYLPPYDLYNLRPGDLPLIADPAMNYHAVRDRAGGLVGFACYGEDAQVEGGDYDGEALDFGCGLAPERVGRGEGTAFVSAVAEHGLKVYRPAGLRLTVAAFNIRAIAVYHRLGFAETGGFLGTVRGQILEFVTMERPNCRVSRRS